MKAVVTCAKNTGEEGLEQGPPKTEEPSTLYPCSAATFGILCQRSMWCVDADRLQRKVAMLLKGASLTTDHIEGEMKFPFVVGFVAYAKEDCVL